MDANDGWLSFLIEDTTFNQETAIRKFCPARTGRQQQQRDKEDDSMEEVLWCPDTTTDTMMSSTEENSVDGFLNRDPEEASKEEDDDDLMNTLFSMVNDLEEEDTDPAMSPMVTVQQEDIAPLPVDQGLHLVHLLLACAEAVGCRDTKLASFMLDQVWILANPYGDSLQRVTFCFAMGLKSRLSLVSTSNGVFNSVQIPLMGISREEKADALMSLYQTTPYISFGFMAANEAIFQAIQGKEIDSIHIVDLGMEVLGLHQWPSLIRTLSSRPEGPPNLRITTIINGDQDPNLHAHMQTLIDDASSLGMSLTFHLITETVTPALFTPEKLNLSKGEVLIINSIMHLHKYVKESRGSLKLILQSIKKLSPTLLTVVEQDANHNGPFFLGRFLESLHYYSAIFDSLEDSLPRHNSQRFKIERLHFGEEIRNIVAYEGAERIERHERADQWRRQLGRAGFQVVGLKCMSGIRMRLEAYRCDGYSLGAEKGCLLLGWKGRSIMLASAWRVHS
ncbi:hypothetical protein ACHQM5_003444 [Ranunculus cassubicifolius]